MYDYHTHSLFSDDCSTPTQDLIEAACKMGIKELAITDHYDPVYPNPADPFDLDFTGYHKMLNEMKEAYQNKIKIIKGIEIGIQHGDSIEKCRNVANSYNYDFIIGSFHSAEGYDLYFDKGFFEGRTLEEIYIAFYAYVLDCLKQFKDYDVIGHFNTIERYTEGRPDFSVYRDLVEETLKIIIADGKGLEINTSSFRYGMGERTTPAKEILDLYAELGGEIITIGSDAHRAEDVGYRFDTAVDIIKASGIKYLATFEQRKLNLISLASL
jgi:histidinol-phosphatase (PHP family)